MTENQRVLVTGASQGLGLEIARTFAANGAAVAVCARSGTDIATAVDGLRRDFPQAAVAGYVTDVGREADVEALFACVADAFGALDVLVVNAGVYGPKGAIGDVVWHEWADAIRINLLGAVYCARRALPLLKRSRRGKIIFISGGGATKPLPFVSAYAASKAGIVRFGETLAEEVRGEIDVNMVAPGALNTRLLDEVLAAGPHVVGEAFHAAARKQSAGGGTPLRLGAELCLFLASEQADGITGKLISAPWDPWQRFAREKERLEGDVYTLRRITPEDRGWSW